MPFNGSGTYSAPSLPGSFNPAVTGQSATPADWNSLLADLSTALSTTMTRDGQSVVTADISLNNHLIQNLADAVSPQDAANLRIVKGFVWSAPQIKGANFAISDSDLWIINSKAGSALVVTLPDAAANIGRALHFQNYQAQPIESSVSNVRSVEGNPLGVTIVSAIAGAWATIVSDGTNWRATQRGT